jgi:hypothetical protein
MELKTDDERSDDLTQLQQSLLALAEKLEGIQEQLLFELNQVKTWKINADIKLNDAETKIKDLESKKADKIV